MPHGTLTFELSPPESVERLRDLAEALAEVGGTIGPREREAVQRKAEALGVHAVDAEAVLSAVAAAYPSPGRRRDERAARVRGWLAEADVPADHPAVVTGD